MKLAPFCFLLGLLAFSCDNSDVPTAYGPVAAFSASDSTIETLDTIQFHNLSSNVNLNESEAFTWYFEGGTPAISHAISPQVVYTNPGQFSVKLIVNRSGLCDSIQKDLFIKVQQSINDGLIGYYPFNGNANDESGYNNNGVVYGALLSSNRFGQANRAYAFDGLSSFIEIVPDTLTLNDFTVSVWARCTGWKNQYPMDAQYIFDGHAAERNVETNFTRPGMFIAYTRSNDSINAISGCGYSMTNDQDIYFPMQWYASNSTYLNDWVHLVIMRSGNDTKMYVNNQLITRARGHQKNLPFVFDHPLYIGTFAGNNVYYYYYKSTLNFSFKGLIDDLRIYNRALSAQEINRLMRLTY